MAQIHTTYTRQHKFVLVENNIREWAKEILAIRMVSSTISHQKHTGNTAELEVSPSPNVLPWKIQGCQNSQELITILELAKVYRLPNLEALTHYFFTKNVFNSAL